MLVAVSAREPDAGLPPGARIGPYEIEALLGRGGQGAVYRARDVRDGTTVALKVRALANGARAAPDAGETDALSRVRHERVVGLRGVVEAGGLVAIALEFVPGGSLSAALAAGPLDGARIERIARDLLAGLAAVHASGFLHRDLKPSNVLLDADDRPKLSDFGIARRVAADEGSGARRVEGSPPYMAPEVILGREPTLRSDLFSLGVILHRAIHGVLPFDGDSEVAVWQAILDQPPARVHATAPRVSPGLLDLVDRCLSKDPARRPASVAEGFDVLDGRAGPPPPEEGRVVVGREAERARLDAWIDGLERGEPRVVLLRGAPGVGTSTVLADAGERARRRGVAWITVVVGPDGFVRPAVRAIGSALDRERGAPSAEIVEARRRLTPAVGDPVSESDQASEAVRDLVFLLRALARDRPLVLAVDQAHEADSDDVRRIDAVVRTITEGRGGALIALRNEPAGRNPWAALGADPRVDALSVGPLAAPHLTELLERRLGLRIDAGLGEAIAARAAGSIPAAVALFAHLRSSSGVVVRGGVMTAATGFASAAVLPDAREQVASALARRTPEERRFIEAAAIDGVVLDPVATAAVLGLDVRSAIRLAREIADEEPALYDASGVGPRFARVAARDAVLLAMDARGSAPVRRALVDHLENRPDPVEPERIARHLEALGAFDRARPYFLRAAVDAANRYERHRFVELCACAGIGAQGIRPPVTPDVVELALRLIQVHSVLRRAAELEAVGEAIRRWAIDVGDAESATRAEIRLAHGRASERVLTRSEATVLRAARDRVASPADRVRASYALSKAWRHLGDLAAAEADSRTAVRVARTAGLPALEATAWDELGTVLAQKGSVGEADAALGRSVEMSTMVGSEANAAVSRIKRARMMFDFGRAMPDLRRFAAEIDRIRSLGERSFRRWPASNWPASCAPRATSVARSTRARRPTRRSSSPVRLRVASTCGSRRPTSGSSSATSIVPPMPSTRSALSSPSPTPPRCIGRWRRSTPRSPASVATSRLRAGARAMRSSAPLPATRPSIIRWN